MTPATLAMYVDGAWVASESGATFDAVSPATGETFATLPKGTRADAGRAIAAVEKLVAALAREIHLGDPSDPATTMGPLNNEAQATKMDRHVGDAVARGARLVAGGRRAANRPTALFYEPTILDDVTGAMEIAREETFGPVAPITVIDDDAEALRIVNDSDYGLLAGVFTRDLARGLRSAEAVRTGWVNINEGTNYWESHLPFGGGAGTDSGVGRVGGRFSMERLTELKTIVLNLG